MPNLKDRFHGLLRWSERYTKTDMVYLASGGFWLAAGQAGAALVAFGFSLVVANYLAPHIYGTYKYVLSLVTIIGAFSLTGLGTTVVRAVAQGDKGALMRGFRTSLAASIPMLLGFAAVAGYYFYRGDDTLGWALAVAGLATLITNAASLYSSYLTGTKEFARYTLYWTIANTLTTSAVIVTILLTNNLTALAVAYFTFSALTSLVFFLLCAQTPGGAKPPQETRAAFHFSVMNFLNTVSSNIDKIIIFQLLGTVQLALYSFALALPEQMRNLLKGATRLALPRFAERPLDSIRATLTDKMIRFGVIIAVIALAYCVAAPFLFQLFFPAYIEAVPYSQFFALTLFGVLGAAPLTALQAHLKHRELYTHAIVTNVIQIISSVVLISLYGLWGAAASLFLNRMVAIILPWILLRRTSEEPEASAP